MNGQSKFGGFMDSKTYSLAEVLAEPSFINFNKLQLTSEFNLSDTLRKRANSKLLSHQLAKGLMKLGAVELSKQYERALNCSSYVLRENDRFKSKFCSNRFCIICNRIKTADLIDGYAVPLLELPDLHFVTLTIQNIPSFELAGAIKRMIKNFQLIKDLSRKEKLIFKGVRKIECTYNAQRKDYHPHFHIVISGDIEGKFIIDHWLRLNPTAKSIAQDIKMADEGSLKELFKYFTKISTSKKADKSIYLTAINTIFRDIRGIRIFQPFGITKKKKVATPQQIQELEEKRLDIVEGRPYIQPNAPNSVFVWSPLIQNFVNEEGIRLLPEFVPRTKNRYFYKNFKYEENI